MASPISFSGLATNLPTDQLIQAVLEQEGAPVTRMQDRRALNTKRLSALRSINAAMLAFNTSLGALNNTSFNARSVVSSDANNTYVAATANGAATGTYDVKVTTLAKKAQLNTLTGVAASTSSVVPDATTATFALLDTDGVTKTFTVGSSNNTLTGLRDAINASGANVAATIVNTGTGATPYQLVLTAKNTGTGSAGSTTFKLADVTSGGAVNTVGIAAGTLTDGALTSGGTTSNVIAVDAAFTANGVSMVRKSNTVSDAIEGVTLTLKAENQVTATTLTVGVDKATITSAMSDVVSKFNTLYKAYKDNAAPGGTLASDTGVRDMIERLRRELNFTPAGLSSGNATQSGAEAGLKTNRDGTLSLDTSAFQKALDANPADLATLFNTVGSAIQTDVFKITSPGSGDLALVIRSIDNQNLRLSQQISSGQARLDKRKIALQNQYASLERTIGQMQAAGQSLSSLSF